MPKCFFIFSLCDSHFNFDSFFVFGRAIPYIHINSIATATLQFDQIFHHRSLIFMRISLIHWFKARVYFCFILSFAALFVFFIGFNVRALVCVHVHTFILLRLKSLLLQVGLLIFYRLKLAHHTSINVYRSSSIAFAAQTFLIQSINFRNCQIAIIWCIADQRHQHRPFV